MIDRDSKANETQNESDHTQEEAYESENHTRGNTQKFMGDTSNVLSLFFSLCLVVASFLTFLAICVQAFIYNYQLQEMKKSTDATAKAAKAAQDAIALARQTSHLDQRAWVAPTKIDGVPKIGQPFIVNITVKNTGKTFSRETRIGLVSQRLDAAPEIDVQAEEDALVRPGGSLLLLPPNGEYVAQVAVSPIIESKDIDLIKSGAIIVGVHGKITYRDIFNYPHWTTFAFRLRPPSWEWDVGEHHNDTDDNVP